VSALGLVQLKRAGYAVKNGVGSPGKVPALHTNVIVNADARQQRDLLPPQPFDPAVAATVGRQPGLGRRDALTARDEELADLGPVIHDFHGRGAPGWMGGTAVTWNSRHSQSCTSPP
jgi:hypothetical protein